MANIINGKEVSLKVKGEVREKVQELKAKGIEAGLAVVMPAVFTYTMSHDVKRFATIARRVWNVEEVDDEAAAKAGIEALKKYLKGIGMPLTFAELGAKEEDIEKLAQTACYGDGSGSGFIYGFTKRVYFTFICICYMVSKSCC